MITLEQRDITYSKQAAGKKSQHNKWTSVQMFIDCSLMKVGVTLIHYVNIRIWSTRSTANTPDPFRNDFRLRGYNSMEKPSREIGKIES